MSTACSGQGQVRLARSRALAASVRAWRMSYIRRDEGGTTELRLAVDNNRMTVAKRSDLGGIFLNELMS